LTTVTLPGGGAVSFQYDPFGRRIRKSSPTGTTIYVYDGDNINEELNASGNLGERYTHEPGIDEPLVGQRQPLIFYYEADGLGSVTSLTDPTGAVAATYTYDSFGFMRESTGSATNWFRYTARQFDSSTALYYYRARYYDPMTGRFLSEDPIGFKGGINKYIYVRNDPVASNDPTGLLRDCDEEHIQCFRSCWGKCPPWPIRRGSGGHYRYCQSMCLVEYMECLADNAARKTAQFCAEHPLACTAVALGAVAVIAQRELAPALGFIF